MNATARRVSVVIPCFRGERFVRDAIDSVRSQEGEEVEVIVVDDGSPDASAEIVEAIADPHVHLLRHDRNRGISAARNTGLEAASGELVAFLDQDDLWLPGRLALQLAELDRLAARGVGLVFCDVSHRDLSGRQWRAKAPVPRRVHELDTEALLARLVTCCFVNLGASLMRRSVVEAAGRFDESIRGGSDDFDLMLRLAEHTRFAHVARTLFVHRLHAWNFTDSQRMTDDSLSAIDRAEARHPELRRAACIGRGRMVRRRAADLLGTGDWRAAAADYRRALAHWPLQPRAWLGLALCALGPAGAAATSLWVRVRRALR